jgi:hypothetical protein
MREWFGGKSNYYDSVAGVNGCDVVNHGKEKKHSQTRYFWRVVEDRNHGSVPPESVPLLFDVRALSRAFHCSPPQGLSCEGTTTFTGNVSFMKSLSP